MYVKWELQMIATEGIKEGVNKAEPIVQQNLTTAKQYFQAQAFTVEELAKAIGEKSRTAVRRIKVWKTSNSFFDAGKNDAGEELYTFAQIGSQLEQAQEHFKQAPFNTEQLDKLLKLRSIRAAQRLIKDWVEQQESTGLYRVPGTKYLAFDPKLAPSKTQQQERHQSIYVDAQTWQILPKHRSEMRDTFYKKNYRQDRLAQVLKRAYAGKDANGNPLYRCAYTNSPQLQVPNHQDFVQYKDGVGEIDHKKDVTQHWKEGGNNMTQAQRKEWYDNPDDLQFLCGSCNSAKPTGTYIFEVGPNFRNPNDRK